MKGIKLLTALFVLSACFNMVNACDSCSSNPEEEVTKVEPETTKEADNK